MDIILIVVLLISIIGIKKNRENGHRAYLSKNQTTAINGIFVMFVFMHHFVQYIDIPSNAHLFAIVDKYLVSAD